MAVSTDTIFRWLQEQAQQSALLTRQGDLHDVPTLSPKDSASGDSRLGGSARENPTLAPPDRRAEDAKGAPGGEETVEEVSRPEYEQSVIRLFDTLLDTVLQKGRGVSDAARGRMLAQLQDLRNNMIRNMRKDFFESFRENGYAGTLPGTEALGRSVGEGDEGARAAPRPNASGDHVAKLREADGRRYRDYVRVENEFREGIDAIYGIRKSEGPSGGTTELIMVYYDSGRWTPGEAETHAHETFGESSSGPGVMTFREADAEDVPRENEGTRENLFFEEDADDEPVFEAGSARVMILFHFEGPSGEEPTGISEALEQVASSTDAAEKVLIREVAGQDAIIYEFDDPARAETFAEQAKEELRQFAKYRPLLTLSVATGPGESLDYRAWKLSGGEWTRRNASERTNPEENFHVARVADTRADRFETFRREDDPDMFERPVHVLYGIRPEGEEGPRGGRSEIAALYYPAGRWNAANARRHAEGSFDLIEFEKSLGPRANLAAGEDSPTEGGPARENYDAQPSDQAHVVRVTYEKDAPSGPDPMGLRTEEMAFGEDDPQVRTLVENAAEVRGGQIVGVRESPSSQVRDLFVRLPDAGQAQQFTSVLNEDFFARGVDAKAFYGPRLNLRPNPTAQSGVDVIVKHPLAQGDPPRGREKKIVEIAESHGGRHQGGGMGVAGRYTGLYDTHLRFGRRTDALEAEADLQELFAEEGLEAAEVHLPGPTERENESADNGSPENGSRENPLATEPTEQAESALTLQEASPEEDLLSDAARLGREAGEEDGTPAFEDEESAFAEALETLSEKGLFAKHDESEGAPAVAAMEEAAAAWAEAYGHATGAEWAGERDNPASTGSNEGRQSPQAGLSFLGLTAAFLGGGIVLADRVLCNKRSDASATG
jgi:hypothetical protein